MNKSDFLRFCGLICRIDNCGFDIGYKLLEYLYSNSKPGKRPTKVLDVLQFISTPCWQFLFGRNVDSLEKGADSDNEYMITDLHPLCSRYISVPKELGEFSCCSFVGGIIRGVLVSAGFPCSVTAYDMKDEDNVRYALYLIRFTSNVQYSVCNKHITLTKLFLQFDHSISYQYELLLDF